MFNSKFEEGQQTLLNHLVGSNSGIGRFNLSWGSKLLQQKLFIYFLELRYPISRVCLFFRQYIQPELFGSSEQRLSNRNSVAVTSSEIRYIIEHTIQNCRIIIEL